MSTLLGVMHYELCTYSAHCPPAQVEIPVPNVFKVSIRSTCLQQHKLDVDGSSYGRTGVAISGHCSPEAGIHMDVFPKSAAQKIHMLVLPALPHPTHNTLPISIICDKHLASNSEGMCGIAINSLLRALGITMAAAESWLVLGESGLRFWEDVDLIDLLNIK